MIINVNDMIPSDSSKLYRYETVNPDGSGTGEYLYLRYAPGELLAEPSVVNRNLLMGIQGFTPCNTLFNADGSITETGDTGVRDTIFDSDGSIIETFVNLDGISINKKTVFNADGSITETVF